MGVVVDEIYKTPLPRDVEELNQRITAAVQMVATDMPKRGWEGVSS